MSARAEQLVLEYLSRAADAAHGLMRSDERVRFIARLRTSIEEQRQAAGAHEPGAVRRVLARFGDPKVLAARERARLDEVAQGAAVREGEGAAARDAGPVAPPSAASPLDTTREASSARSLPPAPATPTPAPQPRPEPSRPDPLPGGSLPRAYRRGRGGAATTRVGRGIGRPAAGASGGGVSSGGASAGGRMAEPVRRLVRRTPGNRTAGVAPMAGPPGRAGAEGVAPIAGPPSRTAGMAPVGGLPGGQADERRGSVAPTAGPRGRRDPPTAFDLASVVRRYRTEVLALILLGPGGLLLPFPIWLVGAAIGLTSWAWSRAEKVIGLGGPFILTLAGIGIIGALNKNPSMPVDLHAYVAASRAHWQLLMRVSAPAGALFLGARLVRAYRVGARRSAGR